MGNKFSSQQVLDTKEEESDVLIELLVYRRVVQEVESRRKVLVNINYEKEP